MTDLCAELDDQQATLALLDRLGPDHRRILTAVIARVSKIEGEAEACALIDTVIDLLRR